MTTYISDIAHYNEVLSPLTLRGRIHEKASYTVKNNQPATEQEEYKFKVYKK